MNKKDISFVKKTLSIKKCTIKKISACYVAANKSKAIIDPQISFLSDEEMALYLKVLSKIFSGKMGSNLVEYKIKDAEKQKELCNLNFTKDSKEAHKKNEEKIFDLIINSFYCETDYCIFLGYGSFITSDDIDSNTGYIIAALCPMKRDKSSLAMDITEEVLRDRIKDVTVSTPVNGFLYPAWTNSVADVSSILYYSKKPEEPQGSLMNEIFGSIEAVNEKTIFNELLKDGEEISDLRSIMTFYSNITRFLHDSGGSTIDVLEMKNILTQSGIDLDENKILKMKEAIPSGEFTSFSEDSDLTLKSGDMILKIPNYRSEDIKVKKVDGRNVMMIPVDLGDHISINGIDAIIKEY